MKNDIECLVKQTYDLMVKYVAYFEALIYTSLAAFIALLCIASLYLYAVTHVHGNVVSMH